MYARYLVILLRSYCPGFTARTCSESSSVDDDSPGRCTWKKYYTYVHTRARRKCAVRSEPGTGECGKLADKICTNSFVSATCAHNDIQARVPSRAPIFLIYCSLGILKASPLSIYKYTFWCSVRMQLLIIITFILCSRSLAWCIESLQNRCWQQRCWKQFNTFHKLSATNEVLKTK